MSVLIKQTCTMILFYSNAYERKSSFPSLVASPARTNLKAGDQIPLFSLPNDPKPSR